MTVVVEGVKTLRKGLFALRTEVALMSVGHQAMFVSFIMTTELTFHSLSR